MAPSLPEDYLERVYAGVLGKTIGVYLGRPFEGWTYELIQSRLGDIVNYVHDQLDVPLIVTDDDISGTFTFIRALADSGHDRNITSRQIGESWMNYLVENRTILWWGGLGNSTEHTAYLRMKSGIPAPRSGSMELNGQVVAEQIGAQIFIDGWAMVSPGDAEQAAHFAREAARVSHDGEAVNGAVALAVMEAMAFVEPDINKLLDLACAHIPTDALIRRLIDDVRDWHAGESDWRATRKLLAGSYGYDKYGGNCHMIPNHGLIVHSLLHGQDDFSETMKIINTSGWDTDCNSGNVGALMGIKNGLNGIDASGSNSVDWRGPVADRIYIPTADPTWGVTDCLAAAADIANAGRVLAGQEAWVPKDGAQFHFSLPGAVQGFQVMSGEGDVKNVAVDEGVRALRLTTDGEARIGTPVFTPSKEMAKYFEGHGYALFASPRIFPGQTLQAQLLSSADNRGSVSLYAAWYGENDQPTYLYSDAVDVSDNGQGQSLALKLPAHAHPVFEVGLASADGAQVHLDRLGWDGDVDVIFSRPPHKGTMWRRAWVDGVDNYFRFGEAFRLIQNSGRGLLIQGTREWRDYRVEADVTPHLIEAAGVAARVQGMRRYYALLVRPGRVQLVKMCNVETVLCDAAFEWQLGETLQMEIVVVGDQIKGSINGREVLIAIDGTLDCGSMALVCEGGRTATQAVRVAAVAS